MQSKAARLGLSIAFSSLITIVLVNTLNPPLLFTVGFVIGSLLSGLIWSIPELGRAVPRALSRTWEETFFIRPLVRKIKAKLAEVRDRDDVGRWAFYRRVAFYSIMVQVVIYLITMVLAILMIDPRTKEWKIVEISPYMWVLLLVHYFFSFFFVVGIDNLYVTEFDQSGYLQDRRLLPSVSHSKIAVKLAIPVFGQFYMIYLLLKWVVIYTPGFLSESAKLLLDAILWVPGFVYNLIAELYSHDLLVSVFWGGFFFVFAQLFYVNYLRLPMWQYSVLTFVTGYLFGYLQIVLKRRVFNHSTSPTA